MNDGSPAFGTPRLSIVIPCYEERKTIGQIVERVRKAAPGLTKEIIVVDDHSTDGTRDLLQGELRSQCDQLILHEQNQGKGAALRSGIKAATGEVVIELLSSVVDRPLMIRRPFPSVPCL